MTLQYQKIFISIACIRCLSSSQCWTVLYISSSLNINMQIEPDSAFSRSIVQLDSDNTVTHLLPIVWVLKLVYERTMKSNYYTRHSKLIYRNIMQHQADKHCSKNIL